MTNWQLPTSTSSSFQSSDFNDESFPSIHSGYGSIGQASNGRASNGRASNGQASNGQASNGQASNGQASNGQASNGQASNGQASNGQASNGQASNGQASNGQASNGRGGIARAIKGQAGSLPSGQYGGVYVLDYKEALAIASRYDTPQRIGVAIFQFMWEDEIMGGMFNKHEYNVNGTSPNGSTTTKKAIDPAKCLILRNFVESKMPHGANIKHEWGKVVTAINKRISYLGKVAGHDQTENEEF
jgi:hypothetical protein